MAKTHKTFSYNFSNRFPSLEITDNSALNTLANNKKAKLAFLFGSNASNINSCINLMKTQFINDYFSSPFNDFNTFREDSGIYNDTSKYAFDSSNFDNQTIQLKSSVPYMAIVLFLDNTEDITKFDIKRSGFDNLSFVSLGDSGDNVGKMFIVKNGSSQYFSMNTNTSTADFVMSYQAETAKHITFTKNLANCTIAPDVDSIDLPTTTILRITANNGYRFNDVPTIIISDVTYNFIENAGVYEYDLSGLSDTTDLQAVINAVAVEIPQTKHITFTKNLANCTIIPDVDSIDLPTTTILRITANNGYRFNDVPTIIISDVTYNFIENAGVYEYDLSGLSDTTDLQAVINAVAVEIPQIKTAMVETDLTNCSVIPDVETITNENDFTFNVYSNNGFVFVGIPTVDFYIGNLGNPIQWVKVNDKQYSFTITVEDWGEIENATDYKVKITANAIREVATLDKYGLILLYKPSRKELNDLGKIRLLKNAKTDDYIDLGMFITSLKSIYLDVDPIARQGIILGDVQTQIESDIINDDTIILDLGNAQINGFYQNGLDNKNLSVYVDLPFINTVELNADIVANKTINIKYTVNLISGDCVANIYLVNSENLILINSYNGVMGFDVPYILEKENIFNKDVSNNLFICKPKVNLFENLKADNNIDLFDTVKICNISDIKSGFIAISEVLEYSNNSGMSITECLAIEKLLINGIEI